jgi:uncharacterized protein
MGSIFKVILLVLIAGCTNLIYQPDRYLYADPNAYGIKFNEFIVRSFDGTRLLAWDLKSKTENPENLVLIFHGNAQNLSSHVFNLAWMIEKKTDVMIFDYRGYGLSEGTPYPRGVVEDGLRFLQFAYDKYKEGGYKRFIVYTQSLGGAIALRALEEIPWRNEISLLVLDSTFVSPQDVAEAKVGKPFKFLISSEFTADKRLTHLTMPLLVIHAPRDPVIPFYLGRYIYDRAPSLKKTFWQLDEAQAFHGNIFFIGKGEYREKFVTFVNAL